MRTLAWPKPTRWPKPKNKCRHSEYSRGALRSQCDTLCNAIVKKRDGYRCTACGSPQAKAQLHWAHLLSRGYGLIRHDLENSTTLCAKCHYTYTLAVDKWALFRRGRMGDARFDALEARAHAGGKPDYKMTLIYLQSLRALPIENLPRPW